MRRDAFKWPGAGLVIVLALFLILVLHEVLVLGVAVFLRGITASEIAKSIGRLFLSSPVYAELMLNTLGGIDPLGIGVSGEVGRLLHQIAPGLFTDPRYVAPGALVSAVVDVNSTVLSVLATRGLVEAVFISLGALFVRTGWHRRQALSWIRFLPGRGWFLVALGLFVETQAVVAVADLTLSPSAPKMSDTGIGFGLSRVLGLGPASYQAMMDWGLPIAIPLVLAIFGFAAAWLLYQVYSRVRSKISQRQKRDLTGMPFAYHSVALVVLSVLTAVTPWSRGYLNMARLNAAEPPKLQIALSTPVAPIAQVTPTEEIRSTEPTPTPTDIATETPAPLLVAMDIPTLTPTPKPRGTLSATPSPTPQATPTPNGPARTEIRHGPTGLELYVNDKRTIITGVNYNVNYTGLPDATKRSLHRRDMRLLRDAGVDALIGWGVYDEVTLEIAHEFQIGVIMPFELDPQGPYENEGYRQRVKNEYGQFIRRFRSYPAVWGWNPGGDELLHRMDTEQRRTTDKLQAAADLLVEMSALGYSLDPDRISIVKEPRDWYIPFFDVALKKERTRRPQSDPTRYFVFGLNVYGQPKDVGEALVAARRNAEERLHVAMVVGEYAPFGLPRADRATYYATIWDRVLADTPNGGFAYVFGPDQPNPKAPNPYDPLRLLVNEFSLVDINGVPADDAFNTLAARWHLAHSLNSPK